jgi:hypothetical protein
MMAKKIKEVGIVDILVDVNKAYEKADKEKKIVLNASITKTEQGKYKLYLYVRYVKDGLTDKIFKKIQYDKYELREVVNSGTNWFYENVEEKSDEYVEIFENFEDAMKRLDELLNKISEYRNKVRLGREYSGFVVI